MAYYEYVYDPSMLLPENYITNEVHAVSMDRSIFPIHGSFFQDAFKLEGLTAGGTWMALEPNLHYTYSPLFLEVAAASAKQAFSYLVLLGNTFDYTQYRISYHVVGQYSDVRLLQQIANATFDRTKLTKWLAIRNNANYLISTRDPNLAGKDTLEVLSAALQDIANKLAQLKPVN